MPRQRSRREATATATTATTETPGTETETTFTENRRMKMPLDMTQIQAIYAKRRTKGLYGELLAKFIESGDNGVSVKEEWATQLGQKKATTLKQGFENAKERKDAPEGSELVDVIVDGEDVYLINRAVTGEVTAEAA